jgi:hypothetical protein
MVMSALGIDAFIQVIVFALLVLMRYGASSPNNTYIIDDDFLMMFLVDYFISTLCILSLGKVFAKLIMRKRYFMLAENGSTASAAYRDMMIVICVIIGLVPYHILF